ncbi:hypothetical protein AB0395_41710 [Streptosporangium sp. NPDC051023]|uniref:hypothetical protein n=1 Tax=Streptosporangium sp. NPDC051023 TaxID=3155410 RepID=UPI0034508518
MSYEEKGMRVHLPVILGTSGAYVAVVLGRAWGVPLAEMAFQIARVFRTQLHDVFRYPDTEH